jgi:hypothetical protein
MDFLVEIFTLYPAWLDIIPDYEWLPFIEGAWYEEYWFYNPTFNFQLFVLYLIL